MLDAVGNFTWNSAGSPLGTWVFNATVTDQFGTAVGRLSLNLVPEPATATLAAFALVGVGFMRSGPRI
jgi:hypothetical protein